MLISRGSWRASQRSDVGHANGADLPQMRAEASKDEEASGAALTPLWSCYWFSTPNIRTGGTEADAQATYRIQKRYLILPVMRVRPEILERCSGHPKPNATESSSGVPHQLGEGATVYAAPCTVPEGSSTRKRA